MMITQKKGDFPLGMALILALILQLVPVMPLEKAYAHDEVEPYADTTENTDTGETADTSVCIHNYEDSATQEERCEHFTAYVWKCMTCGAFDITCAERDKSSEDFSAEPIPEEEVSNINSDEASAPASIDTTNLMVINDDSANADSANPDAPSTPNPYYVTYAAIAATCTRAGVTVAASCSACGYIITPEAIQTVAHTLTTDLNEYEKTSNTNSSGTQPNQKCTVCGTYFYPEQVEIVFGQVTISDSSYSDQSIKKIDDSQQTIIKMPDSEETPPITIIAFKDKEEAVNYVETITVEPTELTEFSNHKHEWKYLDENCCICTKCEEEYDEAENKGLKITVDYRYKHEFSTQSAGRACSHCGYSISHKFKKSGNTYKCSICNYECRHNDWTSNNSSTDKCKYCGATKKHTWTYLNATTDQCTQCKKTQAHSWKKDSKTNKDKCKNCGELKKHAWFDNGSKDKCSDCNTTKNHTWAYLNATTEKCSDCDKTQAHNWKKDSKSGKEKCKNCSKLRNHSWFNNGSKDKCSTCDATKNHTWTYLNATTEKCSDCDKTQAHNWKKDSKSGKDKCKNCAHLLAHEKGSNGKCIRCGKKM